MSINSYYSTIAANNNNAVPNGAPEGWALSDINNTVRQVMADIRTLCAADTITAAGTTDLASKDNTFLTLTSTVPVGITSLGTTGVSGIYKVVIYDRAHSITHNATSLILLGGASRTVAAGDISLFLCEGSGNWRELFFSRAAAATYQPLDATLTALAGLATGASKVPYSTGSDTFSQLTLDTDGTLAANSDTTLATQKATKTYADTKNIATQVAPGTSGNILTSNGSAWTSATPASITLGTPTTASGTSVTFSGIPSTAKQIVISVVGLSSNGTSNIVIQVGDSGGLETSGYSTGTTIPNGGGSAITAYSNGFNFNTSGVANASSDVYHGSFTLSLVDSANHTWAGVGSFAKAADGRLCTIAGTKSTSAALDRIAITTAGGTDTFDAGTINILYL